MSDLKRALLFLIGFAETAPKNARVRRHRSLADVQIAVIKKFSIEPAQI